MCQVCRTVTAVEDGFLRDHRVLICDRDRKWSAEVQRLLTEAGLRVVQAPLQAPNANAYAERFVRSIKEECLDRMIPIGERHFRRAIREFVGHYHHERNHQALDNALIDGVDHQTGGRIRRRRGSWAAQLLTGHVMDRLSCGTLRATQRSGRSLDLIQPEIGFPAVLLGLISRVSSVSCARSAIRLSTCSSVAKRARFGYVSFPA
jgi:hypothetical protein